MGYSGEQFEADKVELVIESAKGKVNLFKYGNPMIFSAKLSKEVLSEREIKVSVSMNERMVILEEAFNNKKTYKI